MANRHRVKLRFEDIIAKGDLAPDALDGFRAQTANGTALWAGTGWNRDDKLYEQPQAEAGGPWQAGRSNRTGE